MNLKYYLRGLGLGIVLTAVLLGITYRNKGNALSDGEIVLRAKALGMIEESELPEYIEEEGLRADIEEELRESLRKEIRAEVEAELAAQADGGAGMQEGLGLSGGQDGEGSLGLGAGSGDEKSLEGEEDSMSIGVSKGTGAANSEGEISAAGTAGGTGAADTSGAAGSTGAADTSGTAEGADAADKAGAAGGTGAADSSSTERTEGIPGAAGGADENGKGTAENTGQGTERVEFIISKGEMAREISQGLESAGLVESASEFESFLLSNGYDRFIKASRYMIPVGADEEQIAKMITDYERIERE